MVEEQSAEEPAITHPVVAIGASAGGLEALQEFFAHLSGDLGASFVVVQHLSSEHPSMMDELLARHTALPIRVIEDGDSLVPGQIYLIPPGRNLACAGDRLRLSEQPGRSERVLNLTIDLFLRSLAIAAGELATAVVLSGTGSDGTSGSAQISERGGIVLVQDPASAKFDGMPLSAIQSGVADVIGTPAELARRLAELLLHPARRASDETHGEQVQDALQFVLGLVRQRHELELGEYKHSTLVRRITRRVPLSGSSSLREYLGRLEVDSGELDRLLGDLLIGVTSFFRDPRSWEVLAREVVRPWTERDPHEELRAWVCACSTGEEAYSLAMLVAETFDTPARVAPPIRIFATDVSRPALEFAATGVYPESIAKSVSAERLERFFERSGDHYRIRSELRRTIVFAPHDVTRQTPFSRMDLVTCRNMLIYMTPTLQHRVLSLLHFSLRRGASLFLGSAEGLLDLSDSFRTVDTKARIFQSTRPSAGLAKTYSTAGLSASAMGRTAPAKPVPAESLLAAALRAQLAGEEAHGFLVSRSNRLLHVLGEAPSYLRLPSGLVTNEIAEMLPRNLSLTVTTALHRARVEGKQVEVRGIRFPSRREEREVDVVVRALSDLHGGPDVELVVIRASKARPAEDAETFDLDDVARQRMRVLELELEQSRENLQATIAELETTNEEQQATNEELLASNEELQSTNEELHSVNEELHTVNGEYQQKIEQLIGMTAEIDGLLDALDVGILFLTRGGHVLRYNRAATGVFRLTPVDIGRPLTHLADNLGDRGERDALFDAIAAGSSDVQVLRSADQTWRVCVTRLSDDAQGRVLVTFVNLTDLRSARDRLLRSEATLEALSNQLPEVLWQAGPEGKIEFIGGGYEALWGRAPEHAIANPGSDLELVHSEDRARVSDEMERGLAGEGFDLRYRIWREDGDLRWAHAQGYPVTDASNELLCTVGTVRDITKEMNAAAERAVLLRRLERKLSVLGVVAYTRTPTSEEWHGDFPALGLSPEAEGMAWHELVHAADLSAVERAQAEIGRFALSYRMCGPSGCTIWVRDRGRYRIEGTEHVSTGALDLIPLGASQEARDHLALLRAAGGMGWRWLSASEDWELSPELVATLGDERAAFERAVRAAILHRFEGHSWSPSRTNTTASAISEAWSDGSKESSSSTGA